jgi:two-component system nitrate/nitrite response regulator NarL
MVDAAIGGDDIEITRIRQGTEVRSTANDLTPDLVMLDLQIGNMGGMAACMELRLDESIGARERVPVLMLLDRDADIFLAQRTDSEGWLVKPLDAFRLRRAATALLGGETFHEVREPVEDAPKPTPA